MKKLRGLLPVLALLLILALWFTPARDNSPGAQPVIETSQQQADEALSLTELPAQSADAADPETAAPADEPEETTGEPEQKTEPAEDGSYTTKEDVSAYLVRYGHLPPNFITKEKAREAGWEGGSLERVLPGMCIGGDYFGNYEGLLPKEKGRKYYECDINTLGKKSRGAERLIYSNDGLVFYTDDHYESFTQLY